MNIELKTGFISAQDPKLCPISKSEPICPPPTELQLEIKGKICFWAVARIVGIEDSQLKDPENIFNKTIEDIFPNLSKRCL